MTDTPPPPEPIATTSVAETPVTKSPALPTEIGGSKKPEPTRYGDWEVGGICSDF
jgi:hypothetical protein